MVERTNVNGAFRMLSALGMILIVAGHADFHIFDLGGLFPYYSFHVELFLFVSGYFYRESDEEQPGKYLKRKVKRLLLPYVIWNLFYGLLAALLHSAGFLIGEGLSLRTLFIEPFLSGHQFGYNFSAWFVPALFLVEAINLFMRKVLKALHLNREWLIMAGCLALGMLTVRFSIDGHVWGYYKLPGRILIMLPAFELGQLYKSKLEAVDRLPNSVYFGFLFFIQLVIVFSCRGLAFSTVWCTGFANGPVIPFLTVLTGIAFWLRVAKILAPLLEKNAFFDRLGAGTYSVMMHHILSFLLVKCVFSVIAEGTPYCPDFDRQAFLTDINYIYVPHGVEAAKWLYLTAGIVLPLLIQYGKERFFKRR